jgi:predicted nucleotidyltransferase
MLPEVASRVAPTQEQLDLILHRVIDAVHPLRVVLFGSAARGEMTPDSDVDLLVVMPNGTHRRHTMEYLHTQFSGLPFPVEVVVATTHDLERYGRSNGLVYRWALEEGRELYAA